MADPDNSLPPEFLESAEETPPPPRSSTNRLALIFAICAAVLGLLMIGLFGYLLLSGGEPKNPFNTADPTPTPLVEIVPTLRPITSTNESDLIGVSIDNSQPLTLTIAPPAFLHIGEKSFTLKTQGVTEGGIWSPTIDAPDVAVWLAGSKINYVVAVSDTTENRALMQGLARGDEMVLTTKETENRPIEERRFTFNERNIVPITNRDIFSQNSTGITIILVGLGNTSTDRMVVRGRYFVDQTTINAAVQPEAGAVANLGEMTKLGDVKIVAQLFDSRPQDASGFSYYLVDYEVTNTAVTVVETANWRMSLRDAAGNLYTINPEAGLVGNAPPLPSSIQPNEGVKATAGYKVPLGLDPNGLVWIVERPSGEKSEIRLTAPQSAELNIQLSLYEVRISDDGNAVLLAGQLINAGAQPINITQSAVTLTATGGATFLLLSQNPPFPWTANPGQSFPFNLAFQRPFDASQSVATFTLLNQSFELTGLR